MARTIRFTVRLTEKEFGVITEFARRKHALPSQSLRMLVAQGASQESRERADSRLEDTRR